MSDLILTIDSDDEQTRDVSAGETNKQGKQSVKKAKQGKKANNEKGKLELNKGKKRAREEDGEMEGMEAGFQFDALGGGEMSSRKYGRRHAWDLNETIDMFRKKNAPPRVTVDDIIARRKIKASANGPVTVANINGDEMEPEIDDEDLEGLEDEDDDEELPSDLDEAILLDGEEEDEDGASPDFGDDDALDLLGGEDGEDDDDDDASVASSSGSSISPFAKLANAAVSLSDAEDEDLNFTSAAEQHIVESNYFSKPAESSTSKVTSNEALGLSTLPPFSALPGAALSRPILLGLSSLNLATPTPIQAQTIPVALLGKDIVGSSITGSGKTVAFWVGILERLLYRDKKEARTRVVVICPTRELAVQVHNVGQALARYTDIRFCLCVGGLSLKVQEADLKKRPDIVVSTPGRLIDHVRNTPSFSLESLEILVIDEADRILEEGFRDELTEIIDSCPHSRQTMLFSATITEDIQTLARLSLQKPVRIAIDAAQTTSVNLKQEFIKVRQDSLREPILVALCQKSFQDQGKTIVFFRSKVGAHRMKILFGLVGLKADELHGDLTQEMRLTALKRFRDGEVGFLLATDLASRGLDIKGIETVINFEMPRSFDIYLHRVGRTARAGKQGRAITLVAESDRKMVKQAVKASSEESTKQFTVPPELIKETYEQVQALRGDIKEILQEEREEKEIRQTEMQITKGQNLLDHEQEIHSRPARTWFQTQKEKEKSKDMGKQEYNDKMDGNAAGRRGRPVEPTLNHRQRRRKEALDEQKAEKSTGRIGSAIRNVKKGLRPGAISQMGDDNDKRGALLGKPKGKKKVKKGGGFKVDLGDKKRKVDSADGGMKSSKKSKTAPSPNKSSSMSKGKKGKK